MSKIEERREELRDVRRSYDRLRRGDTAPLRRCRSAADVALESVYWRIGGPLAHRERNLAHVVLHFPLASQRRASGPFSFGRFLQQQLGDHDGPKLRMRRLLACRDRDELDHRLRGMLRLACGDGAPVDWGTLSLDILWFFAESDAVRRRWAQDFYAPISSREAAPAAASDPNR